MVREEQVVVESPATENSALAPPLLKVEDLAPPFLKVDKVDWVATCVHSSALLPGSPTTSLTPNHSWLGSIVLSSPCFP